MIQTKCQAGNHPPASTCQGCQEKCPVEPSAKDLLAEVAREKYMSLDEAIKFLISYYRREERQRREVSQLGTVDGHPWQ